MGLLWTTIQIKPFCSPPKFESAPDRSSPAGVVEAMLSGEPNRPMKHRSWLNVRWEVDFQLMKQTIPALLLSGCGLMLAGIFMDYFSTSAAFTEYQSLVVMIPVLLGLKCCLEYTLASRLSTSAHKGELDQNLRDTRSHAIRANMGLVLSQAIGAALLASVLATIYQRFALETPTWTEISVVFSVATLTAFTAAFSLGVFTIMVVIMARTRRVDPDNIAGPLVTGLGDSCTVLILGVTALFVYNFPTLGFCGMLLVLFLLPVTTDSARSHPVTQEALAAGWSPILFSLALSVVAGAFLQGDLDSLRGGLSTLVPLVNGIGGNMGSVYASRCSSAIHQGKSNSHFKTALTLILSVAPVHTCFILPLSLLGSLSSEQSRLTLSVIVVFLLATTLQVFLLLEIGWYLVNRAISRNLNPDDHVVPYLSSISDFSGILIIIIINKLL